MRSMAPLRIASAFIPVSDPESAAGWYSRAFGFHLRSIDSWSAVLHPTEEESATALTLMGPASGIRSDPGLPWATCSLLVEDLEATHARLLDEGHEPGEIDGAPETCLFFTVRDQDQNVLLVVDR